MRVGTNLNLNPYNSFSNNEYQGSMQIPNQSSQNLEQRQSTFNNNEINFETENNIIETPAYRFKKLSLEKRLNVIELIELFNIIKPVN